MKNVDRIASRRETAHWKELAKGKSALVLSLEDGNYFELNESALLVWKSIDGKKATSAIAAKLGARYGLSRDAALKDTRSVLAKLEKLKLVEIRSAIT